jgi:hypothetical protein
MRVIVVRGLKACFAGWNVQASDVPSERRPQDWREVSELRSQIAYPSFEGGGLGASDAVSCENKKEGLAFYVTVLAGWFALTVGEYAA